MAHTTKSAIYRRRREAEKAARQAARAEAKKQPAAAAPRRMRPAPKPPSRLDLLRADERLERRLAIQERARAEARRIKRRQIRRELRRPSALKPGVKDKPMLRLTEPSKVRSYYVPRAQRPTSKINRSQEAARRGPRRAA